MPFDDNKCVELLAITELAAADLKEASAALAEVNKETEELQAKNAELEAKLDETLALVKEHEDALAAKAEAFEKLEADKAELGLKLEETSATLTEIEDQRKLDIRTAALGELGLSDERIVKILAKTSELDEEAFGAEVDDLKALMTELTPVPSVLDVVETPEEAADEVVEEEEVVETPVVDDVEEVEASEEEISEVLEEAEEEEAPIAEALGSVNTESEEEEVSQIQSAMAKALGLDPKHL